MIIKTKKGKSKDFTIVSNSIITNNGLSYKARGILIYLLSKPDNWIVRVQDIAKQAPEMGESAVRSGLKELKLAGYAALKQIRENGRAVGKQWVVYEEPLTCTKPEIQKTLNSENLKFRKSPDIVSTDSVVSTDIIKNKEKSDFDFLKFWNSYPRKEGKPTALKAFEALSPEKQEKAISGIEGFVKGKELKFVPSPKRYLEEERWEDEQPAPKKPVQEKRRLTPQERYG